MTTVIQAKPLEWSDLWAAMDARPDEWIQTTEHMHDEMLNCLPPRAGGSGAFLVGEPKTHRADGQAVYTCFVRNRSGYFARDMTLAEFKRRDWL